MNQPAAVRTRHVLLDLAQRSRKQVPLLVVLALLAASMCVLATGHWRRGSFSVGFTVLIAGVLRAVLPTRVAGLLAVRSRLLDTVMLVAVGVAMIALTMVVPHSTPGQ